MTHLNTADSLTVSERSARNGKRQAAVKTTSHAVRHDTAISMQIPLMYFHFWFSYGPQRSVENMATTQFGGVVLAVSRLMSLETNAPEKLLRSGGQDTVFSGPTNILRAALTRSRCPLDRSTKRRTILTTPSVKT